MLARIWYPCTISCNDVSFHILEICLLFAQFGKWWICPPIFVTMATALHSDKLASVLAFAAPQTRAGCDQPGNSDTIWQPHKEALDSKARLLLLSCFGIK